MRANSQSPVTPTYVCECGGKIYVESTTCSPHEFGRQLGDGAGMKTNVKPDRGEENDPVSFSGSTLISSAEEEEEKKKQTRVFRKKNV